MKIKDIITESTVDNLSLDEFKSLLETDFSQAYEQFKKGNILYRGFGSMDLKFNRIQPMRGRESVNTNNFYTIIMNNAERFSEFPKRSVIASTNKNVALSFSSDDHSLAIIFPKNGTKLAMCNAPDIWRAKPLGVKVMGFGFFEIGRMIERIYNWLHLNPRSITTYEDMLQAQKTYEEVQKEDGDKYIRVTSDLRRFLEGYNLDSNFIDELIEKGPKGFYELINTTPFTLFDVSSMKLKSNNEVWFDEEFLAISVRMARDIFGDQ